MGCQADAGAVTASARSTTAINLMSFPLLHIFMIVRIASATFEQ